MQFSATQFIQRDLEKKEWHFFDSNREKELAFFENGIFISYKKYDSFSVLKEEWITIIKKIFELYPDIQVNRIGLRYINQIPLEKDKTAWRAIINEKLLQNFELGFNNISRVFSIINLNDDGVKTTFQYGIHNPDFPSPIKNNLFILDYDVFYEGLLSEKDILNNTDLFHTKIKELFSLSMVEEDGSE